MKIDNPLTPPSPQRGEGVKKISSPLGGEGRVRGKIYFLGNGGVDGWRVYG